MAEAAPSGSSRIFISYRRDDSAGHVLALLPALRNHFGADRIFKDTDSIPPGVDFVKFIKNELKSCSVMLAIIGRQWLTAEDPELKKRRLDNPDDPLLLEVTTALKNEGILVIPVLVNRAVMPGREDLPSELADLSLRNALELSDTRWESDVQRLIQAIERASPALAQPVERSSERPELEDLHGRTRGIATRLQDSFADGPPLTEEAHPIQSIPTDPATLTFTGAHHKRLAEALEKAFPTYQDLEMMVRYRLGLNLESVVARVNRLSYVTFELVRTQVAAGNLLRLIAAARASQPDNPQLALVAEQFGLAMTTPRAELEKILKSTGVSFDVAVWRERLARCEKCVCRITVPTNAGTAHGSGFLVGPDLVLTNHHVIAPVIAHRESGRAPGSMTADPSEVTVRFDYKALDDGTTIHPGLEVALAADWLVDASPHSPFDLQGPPKEGVPDPDELDYALIRLATRVGELPLLLGEAEPGAKDRGWIELPSKPWPFSAHKSLFIIQHPRGAPMKLALDLDARMEVNANGTRVLYQTATEGGSSGSPCFNQFWEVVALHHAGDPLYKGFYNPTFNEGIPISKIVERLRARDVTAGLTIV